MVTRPACETSSAIVISSPRRCARRAWSEDSRSKDSKSKDGEDGLGKSAG